MKLKASPLVRVRWHLSDDGRFAEFLFLNKSGAHLQSTVTYSSLAPLLQGLRRAARLMNERLDENERAIAAEVSHGFASAAPIKAVAVARDAGNGDTLLWLETPEDGGMALRLTPEVLEDLRDALEEHRRQIAAQHAAA